MKCQTKRAKAIHLCIIIYTCAVISLAKLRRYQHCLASIACMPPVTQMAAAKPCRWATVATEVPLLQCTEMSANVVVHQYRLAIRQNVQDSREKYETLGQDNR